MTSRTIPVVLNGATVEFSSENCVHNGLSNACTIYKYAVEYGCPPCTHPGADLSIAYAPLYAATDGVVTFSGYDRYYTPMHINIMPTAGPYKGEVHIYGHLSEIAEGIVEQAIVKRGQRIGTTGTNLDEYGNLVIGNEHLHFERRVPDSRFSSGYLAGDPVPVLTDSSPGTTPGTPEPTFAVGDRIKTLDTKVNFRSAAGTSASIISELAKGTTLCVLQGPTTANSRKWYKVDNSGTQGWVAAAFCGLVAAGGCKTFAVGDKVKVNEDAVNIRESAGISSAIIGSRSKNAQVCITGGPKTASNMSWYQVDAGEVDGWIATSYLDLVTAAGCSSGTSTGPTAIPTTGIIPGDTLNVFDGPLNLRSGAGTGYSIVAAMPQDTKVVVVQGPVTANSYTWYQVETAYGRGWAVIDFMSETTAATNRAANSTASSNLTSINAINTNSTVTRVSVNSNQVVRTVNTGVSSGEGLRYDSATGLALTGPRTFVGVVDVYGKGTLDDVRVRVLYTDGSSSYSTRAPAMVLSNTAWSRIVVPSVKLNNAKTIDSIQLRIRRSTAVGQTFYTDNGKIFEI